MRSTSYVTLNSGPRTPEAQCARQDAGFGLAFRCCLAKALFEVRRDSRATVFSIINQISGLRFEREGSLRGPGSSFRDTPSCWSAAQGGMYPAHCVLPPSGRTLAGPTITPIWPGLALRGRAPPLPGCQERRRTDGAPGVAASRVKLGCCPPFGLARASGDSPHGG